MPTHRPRFSPRRLVSSFAAVAAVVLALSARVPAAGEAVVVVYPLEASGSLGETGTGGRFATLIATRIAAEGGVVVKPYAPGTDRAHYLSAARDEGADYYVTGFMTPIGDEVTVVSQVVSTYSGTVIWSQSAPVKTLGDADGQANAIRAAILAKEGQYEAQIDAPTPSSDDTAPPSKPHEADLSLTGRHRRHGAQSSPSPAPTAAVAVATPAAAATVAVAPVATPPPPPATPQAVATPAARTLSAAALTGRFAPAGGYVAGLVGIDDPALRRSASTALTHALHAASAAAVPNASAYDVATRAKGLCAARSGVGRLYVVAIARGSATTTTIQRLDCRGAIVSRARGSAAGSGAGALQLSIDAAAAEIGSGHPSP